MTTPWGWTGGAGSRTTTPPATPPYPGPEALWREVAYAVHALLLVVTDVWGAVMPESGEVHATALWPDPLRSAGPGPVHDPLVRGLPGDPPPRG